MYSEDVLWPLCQRHERGLSQQFHTSSAGSLRQAAIAFRFSPLADQRNVYTGNLQCPARQLLLTCQNGHLGILIYLARTQTPALQASKTLIGLTSGMQWAMKSKLCSFVYEHFSLASYDLQCNWLLFNCNLLAGCHGHFPDIAFACRDFDEKKPNAFTLLGRQL